MKDIVTIGLATTANLNMEANLYVTRRDFIKAAGVIAGSMALATCGPSNENNTSPDDGQAVDYFIGYKPDIKNFATNTIFGAIKVIRDIPSDEAQKYGLLINNALVRQGLPEGSNATTLFDGTQIQDNAGTTIDHIFVVLPPGTPEIANPKTGEKLAATNVLVGFDPETQKFVPINQVGEQGLSMIFPIVYGEDVDVVASGLGVLKAGPENNEYTMTVPMWVYNKKTGITTFQDPFTLKTKTLEGKEQEIIKARLSTLVPVSEEYKSLLDNFNANSEMYKVNGFGQIEYTADNKTRPVGGIKIDYTTGEMFLVLKDSVLKPVDTTTISFDQNKIEFNDSEDGKSWIVENGMLTEAIVLPEGVKEKFEMAGIDVKHMDNAIFDQEGLHITIEGQETVDIPTGELENFVFEVNGVTEEIYQFLPVIDKETNNMVLYTFNKETKSWEIKDELPLVKISVDKNNPGKCTYLDVLSGNLARSTREQAIIEFPEGAENMGWVGAVGMDKSSATLKTPGNKNAVLATSFYEMIGDFVDTTNKYTIVNLSVLNTDKSIGQLFYIIPQSELDYTLNEIKAGNTGIYKEVREDVIRLNSKNEIFGPWILSYRAQGDKTIKKLITELVLKGIIPPQMEKVLLLFG